uniref:Eukaryotic translation initiation factor 3 subunit B n=1 Tax=Arcella intermedia TaxID=1963864 RepID=A0A6B2KZI3_9EUKA
MFPPITLDLNDYSKIFAIDGLPVIPKEKEEKLLSVLKKILAPFGTVASLTMPFREGGDGGGAAGTSFGCAFVEMSSVAEAKSAVEKLNNYKLDKSHFFKTNMFEDFENYEKMASVYKAPEYKIEKSESLYEWLMEPNGCDQFALRYGKEIEIMWFATPTTPARSVTKLPVPTEQSVVWSPKGTYLVIYHVLGAILVGGPEWKKLRKYQHKGVEFVQFSPCENYIVTCSPLSDDKKTEPIIVWDVKTGHKLRGFNRLKNEKQPWPEFQWSHDDKYFSRVDNGFIYVYETPSATLIEIDGARKPLKLHGKTTDHSWSPTDNLLCAYVPEHESIPARAVLLEIPSRKIVGDRAFFDVDKCTFLWQDKGDYLAVRVDRQGKAKKKLTAFDFFRIREKDIPVEDLKLADAVQEFYWEPKGHRFAVVHAEQAGAPGALPSISFFSLVGASKIVTIQTLPKRAVSALSWSSRGRFVVIINSESFEFYDVEKKETMAKEQKHMMCTNWNWDPTGRYFTTFVSGWKQKSENGFKVWSFKGNELMSVLKEGFYQVEWRPRPPSLVPKEKLEELMNDQGVFKELRKKYKEEDKLKIQALNAELANKREDMRKEFREFFRKKREEWEADEMWRKEKGIVPPVEMTVEEEVTEVLETVEEPLD